MNLSISPNKHPSGGRTNNRCIRHGWAFSISMHGLPRGHGFLHARDFQIIGMYSASREQRSPCESFVMLTLCRAVKDCATRSTIRVELTGAHVNAPQDRIDRCHDFLPLFVLFFDCFRDRFGVRLWLGRAQLIQRRVRPLQIAFASLDRCIAQIFLP